MFIQRNKFLRLNHKLDGNEILPLCIKKLLYNINCSLHNLVCLKWTILCGHWRPNACRMTPKDALEANISSPAAPPL